MQHENAKEMKKLNDDMDELFMYSKPSTSIIEEMNNAFQGKSDQYELVEERKVKTS